MILHYSWVSEVSMILCLIYIINTTIKLSKNKNRKVLHKVLDLYLAGKTTREQKTPYNQICLIKPNQTDGNTNVVFKSLQKSFQLIVISILLYDYYRGNAGVFLPGGVTVRHVVLSIK